MPGKDVEAGSAGASTQIQSQLQSRTQYQSNENKSSTGYNGVHPTSHANDMLDKGMDKSGKETGQPSSPPEISQITSNFQPLSKLFARAAQDCFNGLNDTITALADSHEQQQVNGDVAGSAAGQVTRQSSAKRLQWLDFANTHRERFIKLLVLLQWSKRVGEVSKIIDVFAWMREQELLYEQVDDRVGHLKREMHFEKIPSPDVKMALEILSKGQSSRVSSLDYIPPKPLSATKLLKTLKTVNTLLHIRLNLHETLPPHFRTFRIGSGRATFIIPHEFEVDLSIAEEDPASQFWFIDFRFLFSPCLEIPAGQLRNELEGRANAVLASSGLSGCHDFFHDFVLTFKLNILRRQTSELASSTWAGSLRVEQVHRSLIIQYWTERPGSRNWIEIGVNSGKEKSETGMRRLTSQSQLALRWMRAGKEVEGLKLTQLDIEQLDAGRIINAAVIRHTRYLVLATRDRLATFGVHTEIESDGDHGAPQLRIPMSFSKLAMLCFEPTSGKMSLCPATAISEKMDERLNTVHDQIEQLAGILLSFKVQEILSTIEDGAKRSGWYRSAVTDEKFLKWSAALNHSETGARLSLFKPWASSAWTLGVTVGPTKAPLWWIAKDGPPSTASLAGISDIDSLPTIESTEFLLGRSYYDNLEQVSITHLALQSNVSRLKQLSGAHKIRQAVSGDEGPSKSTPSITIRVSVLLEDVAVMDTFDGDQVFLNHSGVKTGPGEQHILRYLVRGKMHGSADFLHHLTTWRDPDITFANQGAFALQIHTSLDSPCVIDNVKTRLSTLSRVSQYLEVIRVLGFKCNVATINCITFTYARAKISEQDDHNHNRPDAPESEVRVEEATDRLTDLGVELNFNNDITTVTFHPLRANPHRHVRPFLSHILNSAASSGITTQSTTINAFSTFAETLPVTLPVLLALDSLAGKAVVHIRNLTDYRLDYWRPDCAFSICYCTAQDPFGPGVSSMWCIEEATLQRFTPTPFAAGNDKLRDAVAEFWKIEAKMGAENGVIGFGKGLGCGLEQLNGILKRLDEIVSGCEDSEPVDGNVAHEDDGFPMKEEDGERIEAPVAVPPPVAVLPTARSNPESKAALPEPTATPAQAAQVTQPTKSTARAPGTTNSNGLPGISTGPKQQPQNIVPQNGTAAVLGPVTTHGQPGPIVVASAAVTALSGRGGGAAPPAGGLAPIPATSSQGQAGQAKQQQQQKKAKANGPEVITLD